MPTPNAQSAQSSLWRPKISLPTRSISARSSASAPALLPSNSSSFQAATGPGEKTAHEHAIDFATHSWDLATGGLKTLTAKRELPIRPDRRTKDVVPQEPLMAFCSYTFALIILSCIVLILIGGGVVLFVMLQP